LWGAALIPAAMALKEQGGQHGCKKFAASARGDGMVRHGRCAAATDALQQQVAGCLLVA